MASKKSQRKQKEPTPKPNAPARGMSIAEARLEVNDAILFIQNMFKQLLEALAQTQAENEMLQRVVGQTQHVKKINIPNKEKDASKV